MHKDERRYASNSFPLDLETLLWLTPWDIANKQRVPSRLYPSAYYPIVIYSTTVAIYMSY